MEVYLDGDEIVCPACADTTEDPLKDSGGITLAGVGCDCCGGTFNGKVWSWKRPGIYLVTIPEDDNRVFRDLDKGKAAAEAIIDAWRAFDDLPPIEHKWKFDCWWPRNEEGEGKGPVESYSIECVEGDFIINIMSYDFEDQE